MSQTTLDPSSSASGFQPGEEFARHLDEVDPLRDHRELFHIPRLADGSEQIYFAGNSLGLMPKAARGYVEQELDDWSRLGVEAHFKGKTPWYSYHEAFRDMGERLVGAKPGAGEVVMMNSLTVNIHLLLASFYRPSRERYKVLIDEPAFPSDLYAVKTHLRARGIDPRKVIVSVRPRPGDHVIRIEDVKHALDMHGDTLATAFFSGVNFLTGTVNDLVPINKMIHGLSRDIMVGVDLAHAAGNIPLHLHDWNLDFACWCSYKYLNAGPGAVAGVFIHERHAKNTNRPRLGGWWGNDPDSRFQMQLNPEFTPVASADGWQVSNPPILSMAPLRASLEIFDKVGMEVLRTKSQLLTGYLRWLIEQANVGDRLKIITPREPALHGCQLSIQMSQGARECFKGLEAAGVACDFREPDIIRVAPVPLYNSFHEAWRFAQALAKAI